MTSLYRRCNVFNVILNDKGRNSVEQNAIVHDNSDRALLRPQAPLLQSANVVNQWISKDISCDALMWKLHHQKHPDLQDISSPQLTAGGKHAYNYEMNFTLCVLLVYNDNGSVQTLCITRVSALCTKCLHRPIVIINQQYTKGEIHFIYLHCLYVFGLCFINHSL